MGVEAFTDREYHKTAPMPSDERPSIYAFRRPERDWVAYLFDNHAPLPPTGRLLDAGCGPGLYVPAASARVGRDRLIAFDINQSRLQLVPNELALRTSGDVEALPFPDATFETVLAMHMLYHVPDIAAAVAEFRRVLRPGGVLYAFTNGERAQHELTDLYVRHGGSDEHAMGDSRFSNESGGEWLRTAFADDEVSLAEFTDSELVVPDAECVIDELQRLRYTLEPSLRPGVEWEGMIEAARRDVAAVIEREGAFRMSENHGLFTCRKLHA